MTEKTITVFIYLPGETIAVPAGLFTHSSESGIGTFAYGRRYIERKNALPVDPIALPLGVLPQPVSINGGLYGVFRDAAPDYWGRLIISVAMSAPPEALSEADYLLAANATRAGNLDFRMSPRDPEPRLGPPHFNTLPDIMDAAEKIGSGRKADQNLFQLLRQGSSLGGARPKCTVEWEDGLWIAKFPAKGDSLNIPRIEYAAMNLAGRCGIRIPEVRVISVGKKDVFMIRRFDREKSGDAWLRQGFLSGLSLMQWDERDRMRWDYPAIADAMRRYTTAEDIRELFRRMIFNILVRNTDDHPRNHGFLTDAGKISLSPAYDIVPAPSRAGIGTDFYLAMSVGDKGRQATLKNALSRAARFGISNEEAFDIVGRLRGMVCNWREHFEAHGVSAIEADMLAPSFERCHETLI
ncbi:HipA domain-containing protein [Desulfococcaceae bacterium HSG8]|nr:HipA domain-containing protein [Desulfococcaceae bacterium HSG8]